MDRLRKIMEKLVIRDDDGSIRLMYIVACYGLAIVHLLLLCFFVYMNIAPMAIFNVFSVLLYIVCRILVNCKRYVKIFILVYAEVFIHSTLATMLVGWDLEFGLYNLAIIPVSFYMGYILPRFRQKMRYSFGLMIVNMILTLFSLGFDYYHGPAFALPTTATDAVFVLRVINILIAFSMISLFGAMFIIEIQMRQQVLEQQNTTLERMANYDPLTGLLNRWTMEEHFAEAVRAEWQDGEPFCIALCDIDDFKDVNDTYGHECGDKVLRHIAKLIVENVEKEDYVCRWGGEEFLFLFKSTFGKSYTKAEILRKLIENTEFIYEGKPIKFTMTFGVEKYVPGLKVENVIHKADLKLYKGKETGKNQVVM